METLSHADARRMYSWWWDSHMNPKNSKWLQENLTDMDVKVKAMIKIIEEDGDSFARRAEMYYRKRPELRKLVEEFHRAYRALAERYDHATGVLHQAHQTIAEAFPNHVPSVTNGDFSTNTDTEPCTPEMQFASFEPDDLRKDIFGVTLPDSQAVKRNGAFTECSEFLADRKKLEQLNDLFGSGEAAQEHPEVAEVRARKSLKFQAAEEGQLPSPCPPLGKSENEIAKLEAEKAAKVAQYEQSLERSSNPEIIQEDSKELGERESKAENEIAKLEAEKAIKVAQYEQSLERLSNPEIVQEDSRELDERDGKADVEVQTLKETCTRLEAEREASLLKYQKCLEKIHILEDGIARAQEVASELNERASEAENKTQALNQDLSRLEPEKDLLLRQLSESMKLTANLETKLLLAEEAAAKFNERADKAESEVEILKHALATTTEEKDGAVLQCQQNMEEIYTLKHELSQGLEEVKRLNEDRESKISMLKDAEERCYMLEMSNQSLHAEFEPVVFKMNTLNQEVMEKQQEMGRLWTCLQEERLQFMEAETAFQSLQHQHSYSLEELRSLAAELDNSAQILKDMECRNQGLQNEIQKVKEESMSLNELNLSSAVRMKNMQNEISRLREMQLQLEEEIGFRVDQRNALQQEIYCLKEELNVSNKKLQALAGQVNSVGLNPESFGSFVKELQDEGFNLKEICQKEKHKANLAEKLEKFRKVLEKNIVLENSLSDVNAELEGFRGKSRALEESCQALVGENLSIVAEKGDLASQLQIMGQSLENLSEKNNILENSLFDAEVKAELEIFILHKCIEALEEKNLALLIHREKISRASEKLISDLQHENFEQRMEIKSLDNHFKNLRFGMFQICKALDIESGYASPHENGQDQLFLNHVLGKLEEARVFLHRIQDENQQLVIEKSVYVTLLGQLKSDAVNLETKKNIADEDCRAITTQFSVLLNDTHKFQQLNEELALKLIGQDVEQKLLTVEMDDLNRMLLALQNDYFKVLEEKRSLSGKFLEARELIRSLEEENSAIRGEAFSHSNLSLLLMNLVAENSLEQNKMCANLNHEIACKQDLLHQKEVELLEAERKLTAFQNDKTLFHNTIEDLRRGYHELEVIIEDQERQIDRLAQENDHWNEKNKSLCEAMTKLEADLCNLQKEQEDTKIRVGSLTSDLELGRDEVTQWQNEAASILGKLQEYVVREALFEEKIHELVEELESFQDQRNSKNMEISLLSERNRCLESENGDLKSQMVSYISSITALKDSVRSLESHTILHKKLHSSSDVETKEIAMEQNEFPELQELQTRIMAAERAVAEMNRAAEHETSRSNIKLGAAMRQIEELQAQGSRTQARTRALSSESSEAGHDLTKDIMLDHVCKCSSYRLSKRRDFDVPPQASEIWETTSCRSDSIEQSRMSKGKTVAGEEDNKDLSSSSRSFCDRAHQVTSDEQLIIEQLAADAQKLVNLRITVQDLKRKVEVTEKTKRTEGVEYGKIKVQMGEAEETMRELLDANEKLMKPGNTLRQSGSQVSERIRQLQVEVQKIQFGLLKLEDGKGLKARMRNPEKKARVVLRDYLYGGLRGVCKQKKGCCSCVQPSTS